MVDQAGLQNLRRQDIIVNPDGTPTEYFQRLLQGKSANSADIQAQVDAIMAELAGKADKIIVLTAGTGLTGGGDLSADRTFSIDTPAEAERIRDVIGATLVAGANITITVDDPGNTITIAATGGGGGGGGGARPIVAKAKVEFSTTGVITLVGAENVASVTRVSAGIYDVVFSNPIPAGCVALISSRFGDVVGAHEAGAPGVDRPPGKNVTTTGFTIVNWSAHLTSGPYDPWDGNNPNSWMYFEVIDPTVSSGGGGSTLISEVTTSANQASVTFSSIPATFKKLELRIFGRTNRSGNDNDNVLIRFNGDSGANYGHGRTGFFGTSSFGETGTGETSAIIGTLSAATSQANGAGIIEAEIPYYANTAWWKNILSRGMSVGGGAPINLQSSAFWKNTAAITSISVAPQNGSFFIDGTIVALIGVPY